MQRNCIRLLVALSAALIAVACQSASGGGVPHATRQAPDAAVESCPSQDFAQFLKLFADPDRADLRQRYTAMPLEREGVTEHLIQGSGPEAPPMSIIAVHDQDRQRYFKFRYIARLDDYRNIRADGTGLQKAINDTPREHKFPMRIETENPDERLVVFGMETEVDTFLFERREGCWYLKRATDLRD